MISRIDNENLYYMESDDVLQWDQAQPHSATAVSLAGDPDSATAARPSRLRRAGC